MPSSPAAVLLVCYFRSRPKRFLSRTPLVTSPFMAARASSHRPEAASRPKCELTATRTTHQQLEPRRSVALFIKLLVPYELIYFLKKNLERWALRV